MPLLFEQIRFGNICWLFKSPNFEKTKNPRKCLEAIPEGFPLLCQKVTPRKILSGRPPIEDAGTRGYG